MEEMPEARARAARAAPTKTEEVRHVIVPCVTPSAYKESGRIVAAQGARGKRATTWRAATIAQISASPMEGGPLQRMKGWRDHKQGGGKCDAKEGKLAARRAG